MKEFSCGDVVPGCTAGFRAASEAELLEAVAGHARADHGITSIPDGLLQQIRANIHSVA